MSYSFNQKSRPALRKSAALLLAIGSMSAGFAGTASAQDSNIYIRGFAGYTFSSSIDGRDGTGGQFRDVDVESAASGGLALGYAFNNNLRAELEVSRRSADLDGRAGDSPSTNPNAPPGTNNRGQLVTSDFSSTTVFLNLYYDYSINAKWDVFAGGGIGIGFHDVESVNIGPNFTAPGDHSTEFVWNVGVGAAYAINDNLKLDVMYRYIDLGTATSGEPVLNIPGVGVVRPGADRWDASQQEVSVGLRYTF